MNMDENSRASFKRLQTLTDCFYAFALILLVVFIEKPPDGMLPTEDAIKKYLFGQFDLVIAYLVTFTNIAFFWYFSHNESKYLKRSDGVHTWLNVISLMFVGLLPFSSALSAAFPASLVIHLFYSSVVFLVGLLFCIDWLYAIRKDRLVDCSPATRGSIDELTVESLVQPIAAILSLGGAFISTFCWELPYLLVPVATFLISKRWARRAGGKALSGKPK